MMIQSEVLIIIQVKLVNSIGVDWSKQKLSIAVISKAIVNKIIILKWRWFEALVKNGVFVGNENRPILMVVKILSWDLIIYIQTVDMRQIAICYSFFPGVGMLRHRRRNKDRNGPVRHLQVFHSGWCRPAYL